MLQTIERSQLPERMQTRGLDLVVTTADLVPDLYVQQIVEKSRQPHVLQFEDHEDVGTDTEPGRYRDIDSYRAWAEGKKRVFYMMVNNALHPDGLEVPDIGGVIWFGYRINEHAPGRNLTFATRLYAADSERGWDQYVRTGLGSPFMKATHQNLRDWYPDEKIWLDLAEDNEAAYRLYSKNGYEEVARLADPSHGDQRRIVMTNDTALRRAN